MVATKNNPWYDYHSREILDADGSVIGYGTICYEDGTPIPVNVCICAAREYFECGCGTWTEEDDFYI